MKLEAGCKTTAMGIMPHTDIERALDLTLSLDIPFWPQLPNVSFYEDMYVQTSRSLPGILVDHATEKIRFNTLKFEEELLNYLEVVEQSDTFALTDEYSVVYHRFLQKDLPKYPAVRGQVTGPISFGFRVVDESLKPIIYNDQARMTLFDFIQRKINVQYRELKEKNKAAFVWVDEPGLGYVFSALSGYNDIQARQDYRDFMEGVESPKAMHLCANVYLPYLLDLGLELLSFDALQMEFMPVEYAGAVAEFLRGGGIISWGIVPTDTVRLVNETPETLAKLLSSYWEAVSQGTGLPPEQIAQQALIAPARCCLKNIGEADASDDDIACKAEEPQASPIEERIVERAFAYLRQTSSILQDQYKIST